MPVFTTRGGTNRHRVSACPSCVSCVSALLARGPLPRGAARRGRRARGAGARGVGAVHQEHRRADVHLGAQGQAAWRVPRDRGQARARGPPREHGQGRAQARARRLRGRARGMYIHQSQQRLEPSEHCCLRTTRRVSRRDATRRPLTRLEQSEPCLHATTVDATRTERTLLTRDNS